MDRTIFQRLALALVPGDVPGTSARAKQPLCLLLLLLAALTALPGCGGCRTQPVSDEEQEKQRAEEKAKKAKEKPKPPLEVRQDTLLPPPPLLQLQACKPGHWVGLQLVDAKANLEDFTGQLQTEVVDRQLRPAPLVAVPYEMTTYRPALLAKEQPKSLEAFAWIPPTPEASSLDYKLTSLRGVGYGLDHTIILNKMPSYQYYIVVLARFPSRYDYLDKSLASIHLRRSDSGLGSNDTGTMFYRVSRMSPGKRPPLPSRTLFWTSIAYVLWDDADPTLLDLDQQQALLDWLHWGGQLILSGPDTLDTLRTSFLGPYLPATSAGSRTLTGADLAELAYWSGTTNKPPRALQPWSGVQLKNHADARVLPHTGGLIVERSIGRGRVVVSAFHLTGPELTQWAGYDCLFNACLLRRPARRFSSDQEGEPTVDWAGVRSPAFRRNPAPIIDTNSA